MYQQPPSVAEKILVWALGPGDAARTVLGDVNEDYAGLFKRRGQASARLWYWKEALTLSASSLVGRAFGRPIARMTTTGESTMRDALSTMGWVQDARYAFKAIRKDLGFFLFATAIIGLGVGASTAVFSVVSPLLLQPLPFEDPGRLTWIAKGTGEGVGLSLVTSRTSNLRDLRELSRSFDGLTGYNAFFEQKLHTKKYGFETIPVITVTLKDSDVTKLCDKTRDILPRRSRGFYYFTSISHFPLDNPAHVHEDILISPKDPGEGKAFEERKHYSLVPPLVSQSRNR